MFCIFCYGCDKEEQVIFDQPDVNSMGQGMPDFTYELQKPHLILDINGYCNGDSKIIYIEGDVSGQKYYILDSESEEIKYEGVFYILDGTDNQVCYGDFSSLDESGTYIAYNPKYGYSYEFVIADQAYTDLYKSVYEQLKNKKSDSILDKSYRLAMLMLSGEIYSDSFTDWAYINIEQNKLLEDANKILLSSANISNYSEVLGLAGMLAQYGKLYYDFDEEEADISTETAKLLYDRVMSEEADVSDDTHYYALTQLYRATGNTSYRDAIGDPNNWTSGDFTFLADMSYIMSEHPNDYDKCYEVLTNILDEASKTAEDVSADNFINEFDDDKVYAQLDSLLTLGVADYAFSRNGYSAIRRKYVHYICGCNRQMRDILSDADENIKDLRTLSKIVFVMGI